MRSNSDQIEAGKTVSVTGTRVLQMDWEVVGAMSESSGFIQSRAA